MRPRITNVGWYCGLVDQLQIGKSVDHARHRCRQLHTGERCADAEVDAATEPDVGGVVATDVEPVGIVETARVALGRAEQHHDLVADVDLLPGDFDAVLEHPPFEHLQR